MWNLFAKKTVTRIALQDYLFKTYCEKFYALCTTKCNSVSFWSSLALFSLLLPLEPHILKSKESGIVNSDKLLAYQLQHTHNLP